MLLSACLLTGCGGGGGGNKNAWDGSGDDATPTAQVQIAGEVAAVSNSSIVATTADNQTVWSGQSDDQADYEAVLALTDDDFPVELRARDGNDLVTGAAPDFELRGALLDSSTRVSNLNAFSTLIVATAESQRSGVNESSVVTASDVVLQQLNFGLDTGLIDDPMSSPVQRSNVATVIRSGSALAEMMGRTRQALLAAGLALTAEQAVQAVGADLVDGVLDGRGAAGSDPRIAATASLAGAQIALETLTNGLRIDGYDATDRMNSAISMIQPDATRLVDDLRVRQELLAYAKTNVGAAQALMPSAELDGVRDALDTISAGSTANAARNALPTNAAVMLEPAIAYAASGVASDHEAVNGAIRASLGAPQFDQVPPNIALRGAETVALAAGEPYVEMGALATDNRDGDISSQVQVDGAVDPGRAGRYTLTYNVFDSAGNPARERRRTVTVAAATNNAPADSEPPTIRLLGANPLLLAVGDQYVEPGARATDDVDGDVSSSVVIDRSGVSTANAGNYRVTYNVADSAGNQANQVVRSVIVEEDSSGPTVTNNGPRPWENILSEAAGFGRNVTGGAGGELITVRNLNDDGPGSLREAVARSGRKWIRFSPGLRGTIRLQKRIYIKSNTTIDGRGADITLTNYGIRADAGNSGAPITNIFINNLKIESLLDKEDGINLFHDTRNVWINNVSITGAGDEGLGISDNVTDVTVSWSHFYRNNLGILVRNNTNRSDYFADITIHHSHFDSNSQRNPRSNFAHVHLVNNYIRNWEWTGAVSTSFTELVSEANIYEVGNFVNGDNQRLALRCTKSGDNAAGEGYCRSVGDMLLNGATIGENRPNTVFNPRDFYTFNADTANNALRNRIVNGAGWVDTSFPE